MTTFHGKSPTQEVGKPIYEIGKLFFSYDEKAQRFDAVIYTLHPADLLDACFENVIEPAILSLCPSGSKRSAVASKRGPSVTRRTYTYITAPWRERLSPMLALPPPRIEVTLTESTDDLTPSVIEITQYDSTVPRVIQLYGALVRRSDVSHASVQSELRRLAQLLGAVESP